SRIGRGRLYFFATCCCRATALMGNGSRLASTRSLVAPLKYDPDPVPAGNSCEIMSGDSQPASTAGGRRVRAEADGRGGGEGRRKRGARSGSAPVGSHANLTGGIMPVAAPTAAPVVPETAAAAGDQDEVAALLADFAVNTPDDLDECALRATKAVLTDSLAVCMGPLAHPPPPPPPPHAHP